MERVKGIEPSSSAWKAVALPLSYTRVSRTVAAIDAGAAVANLTLPEFPRKGTIFSSCTFCDRTRRPHSHCPWLVEGVGFEPT